MADLLECLIQIKALRETLDMVTGLISAARPAGLGPVTVSTWQRMAEAERGYAQALGTAAAGPPRVTPASGDAAEAMEVFLALRRANLARLGSCTASQLAAPVAWAGRPATTVADLVAIMLASDTERLAGHRQAVRAARIPAADPA
ncbi:MAG TPA: hypothetical protein VLN08_10245 [Vicinamibacterales bacterium]|nr:hypothetical protein [Vicinamibacterales bacterium]